VVRFGGLAKSFDYSTRPIHAAAADALSSLLGPALSYRLTGQMNHGVAAGETFRGDRTPNGYRPHGMPGRAQVIADRAAYKSGGACNGNGLTGKRISNQGRPHYSSIAQIGPLRASGRPNSRTSSTNWSFPFLHAMMEVSNAFSPARGGFYKLR
jgi:hypothetical protein